MDTFADIGRTFATPQFIVTVIFSFGFIIGGIMLVAFYKPLQPPSVPGMRPNNEFVDSQIIGARISGAIMIVIGTILPFAAWWHRKLVRTNPNIAAMVGFLDVARMLRA